MAWARRRDAIFKEKSFKGKLKLFAILLEHFTTASDCTIIRIPGIGYLSKQTTFVEIAAVVWTSFVIVLNASRKPPPRIRPVPPTFLLWKVHQASTSKITFYISREEPATRRRRPASTPPPKKKKK